VLLQDDVERQGSAWHHKCQPSDPAHRLALIPDGTWAGYLASRSYHHVSIGEVTLLRCEGRIRVHANGALLPGSTGDLHMPELLRQRYVKRLCQRH
jgi:alkylhydroperoxidase/carboxymuconolactone decarboxylase family protein YurZ